MNWRNKDDFGDPAMFGSSGRRGGGRNWREILLRGDNPLFWSVPVGRVSGITVRVAWFFIIYAVVVLVRAALDGWLPAAAMGMGGLFLLVLLHEFGHCIACRRVGGTADEILMWPLGGLAYCRPPHHWRADFITTAGGPLVNVVLIPVLGALVWLVSGNTSSLLFNPFTPGAASVGFVNSLAASSDTVIYLKQAVWWLYYDNIVLLLFNLLLPMYPLDGARMAQALMWRKMGRDRSVFIAATVGLFTAMAVGVFAIAANVSTLVGLAIFGGITCWNERRMLAAAAQVAAEEPYGSLLGRGAEEDPEDEPSTKRTAARAEQAARAQAELDRILAKIAKDGMGSLSRKERRVLEGETKRRRGT